MLCRRSPYQELSVQSDRESLSNGEFVPSRLILIWMDREYVVTPGTVFLLGNSADADLCIPGAFVSAFHATIEFPARGHRFELVDHSTNGTLVQTEDEHVRLLHRDRLPMWGEGWFSLGQPLAPTTALRYSHV